MKSNLWEFRGAMKEPVERRADSDRIGVIRILLQKNQNEQKVVN